MAYTSPVFTAVAGGTILASQHNTYVRDNLAAVWVGTTAGDIDYYTGATAKARLALVVGGLLYGGASAPGWLAAGGNGTFLYNNGASSPAWLALGVSGNVLRLSANGSLGWGSVVEKREGGDPSNWSAAGTNTYTPAGMLLQSGVNSVSGNASSIVLGVTFPTTYSDKPIVIANKSVFASAVVTDFGASAPLTTGFSYSVKFNATYSETLVVQWLAIGPP